MSGKILEVHTISSAAGWIFDEDFGENVACFALVTVRYEDSSTAKMVIALGEEEIGLSLIDDTVSKKMLSVRREE